jgi:hypothetical protein
MISDLKTYVTWHSQYGCQFVSTAPVWCKWSTHNKLRICLLHWILTLIEVRHLNVSCFTERDRSYYIKEWIRHRWTPVVDSMAKIGVFPAPSPIIDRWRSLGVVSRLHAGWTVQIYRELAAVVFIMECKQLECMLHRHKWHHNYSMIQHKVARKIAAPP